MKKENKEKEESCDIVEVRWYGEWLFFIQIEVTF